MGEGSGLEGGFLPCSRGGSGQPEKNKKEKGRVLHRKWEGGKSANFEKKDKNM